MLEAYHHSGDCRYRQHPRALKTGEQTALRLWTGGAQVRSVFLRIQTEKGVQTQEMTLAMGYWQTLVSAPEESGLLWYDFSIHMDGKTMFYGAAPGETAGPGQLYDREPPPFQLTVFSQAFQTPDWAKNGILYQIFPDRFCRGNPQNIEKALEYRNKMGRKTLIHRDWDEEVLYLPYAGEKEYQPFDFYGGDFAGIAQSLGRLKQLGVSVIYLNPISEACSNHRYDTADYNRPDPFLGSEEDFIALTEQAGKLGIRIILDGVYSHTGADSLYFNREANYPQKGAWQGKESPYYHWYDFGRSREEYRCWWGFRSLPEVNELDPSWQSFVITGDNSVIANWMNRGAAGFRLDVADELPDEVIAMIRTRIKQISKDSFLIGEVWEDATTKESYGQKRKYALGDGLDSVMNYPFRNACVNYLLGKLTAIGFRQLLLTQQVCYPKEMYYALMNLLSSHDIPRIRTVLSLGGDCTELDRRQQAEVMSTPQQNQKGAALQRLAVAICYAIPGMPSVYYGDEFGMQGLRDPFNRRSLHELDPEMAVFYQKMASLRVQNAVLQTGFAQFHATADDLLAIHRFTVGGKDAFKKNCPGFDYLFLLNRSDTEKQCEITLLSSGEGIDEELYEDFTKIQYRDLTDVDSDEWFQTAENRLSLKVPPRTCRIFRLNREN